MSCTSSCSLTVIIIQEIYVHCSISSTVLLGLDAVAFGGFPLLGPSAVEFRRCPLFGLHAVAFEGFPLLGLGTVEFGRFPLLACTLITA